MEGSQNKVPKFLSFKPKDLHVLAPAGASKGKHDAIHPTIVESRLDQDMDDWKITSKHHNPIPKFLSFKSKPRPVPLLSGPFKAKVDTNRQAIAGPKEDPTIHEWEDIPSLFKIDLKGDLDNARFGYSHHYALPPYARNGDGRVIGLPSHCRIDRSASTDKIVVIGDIQYTSREKSGLTKIPRYEDRDLELVYALPTLLDMGQEVDFIKLNPGTKRKRESESPVSWNKQLDTQKLFETENPSLPPSEDQDIKQKNIELSQRTKDRPEDAKTWQELINHQDKMSRLGLNSQRCLTNAEQRNLSEVKISIYEKALEHTTVLKKKLSGLSPAYTQLLLSYMEEGSRIWETDYLSSKWKAYIKENPTSYELWVGYLNHFQTSFVEFSYEDCRATFLAGVSAINKTLSSEIDPTLRERLKQVQVYLILRLTTMTRETGYQELALATWQALFEYHLFRPTNLISDDDSSALAAFQSFWESEGPRIGEAKSLVSRNWTESQENMCPISTRRPSLPKRSSIDEYNCFKSFAELEVRYQEEMQLPGRASQDIDEDEEDYYHIILFKDINEVLHHVPKITSPLSLLDAFLCFWQMPPLPNRGQGPTSIWWSDPLLNCCDSFSGFSLQLTTTEYLFSNAFSQSKFGTQQLGLIHNTIKSLAFLFLLEEDFVAEYYLAFELHFYPDNARKAAKAILKKRLGSLRLYNAYGLIESRLGNRKEADKVFITAITTRSPPVQDGPNDSFLLWRKDEILLWRTWVWEALHSGEPEVAYSRLLRFGDPDFSSDSKPISPQNDNISTHLLRARKALENGRDHMLSHNQFELVVLHTECLALLDFLHSNSDISTAVSRFQETSEILRRRGLDKSTPNELNHQARAQFLDRVDRRNTRNRLKEGSNSLTATTSTRVIIKPSLIRNLLEESIQLFPQNSIFMDIYSQKAPQFKIDIRASTDVHNILENDTITGWSFTILARLQKGETSGPSAHSIRSAFERAVACGSCSHNFLIWASYFHFELSQSSPDRLKRTKLVFQRGLGQLPWSKPFMMLAFGHLTDILTFEELKRIYDAMIEKGFRLYADLEEVLEKIEDYKHQVGLTELGLRKGLPLTQGEQSVVEAQQSKQQTTRLKDHKQEGARDTDRYQGDQRYCDQGNYDRDRSQDRRKDHSKDRSRDYEIHSQPNDLERTRERRYHSEYHSQKGRGIERSKDRQRYHDRSFERRSSKR